MTTVERLAVPKGQDQALAGEVGGQAGIPPEPLPTWTALPLDAKLPMIPGPKGAVVLYTTNLGEKIHKSSRDLDFDLTDPNAMVMSNNYKPLHDPHLKPHLTAPQMKTRLQKGGFITHDGKVVCTLKEFNEYRQYLRKITLALKRRQRQELDRRGSTSGRPDRTAESGLRAREGKVRKVRQRLAQQREEDRQRYLRLMVEEEERRLRLREEHLSRMSEKERLQRQAQQEKLARTRKKQKEDQRRKLAQLRKWVAEDQRRAELASQRCRERNQQRQRKLEETWEERKRVQLVRLEADKVQRLHAEELKRMRIEKRDETIRKHRQRMDALLLRITEQHRADRQRAEEEHARRFQQRVQQRRAMSARRRQEHARMRKKLSRRKLPLKSNWDLEQALLQTLSGDEDVRRRFSDGEGPLKGFFRGTRDSETRSLEDLGLGDYRGARLSDELLLQESGGSFLFGTDPPYIRDLMDVMFDKDPADYTVDDAAHAMVKLTTYLSSQVLCPAIDRYYNELLSRPITPLPYQDEEAYGRNLQSGQSLRGEEQGEWFTDGDDKSKKSLRNVKFSFINQTIPIYSYDWEFSDSDSSDAGWDYRAEEGDDEDEGFDPDKFGALLAGKDSFTRGEEHSLIGRLTDILKVLLQRLNTGTISTGNAQLLLEITSDILGLGTQREEEEASPELEASDTSLLAAQVIEETIAKVQRELLPIQGADLSKQTQDAFVALGEAPSVTALTQLIVEQVLAMAVKGVLGLSHEETAQSQLTMPPDQLYAAEDLSQTSLGIDVVPVRSTASVFVEDMVQRVAQDIQKEITSHVPPGQVQSQLSSVGSSIESFVNDVLESAVMSLQVPPEKVSLFKKKSSTSSLVEGTLEKVVKELEEDTQQTRSTTSLYVNHVIENAVAELSKEHKKPGFLSWARSKKMSPPTSKSSLTSVFVKEMLTRVATEVQQEQHQTDSGLKTESSVFIEELINATIAECIQKIRSDIMSRENLTKLTGAIVSSHKGLEGSVSLPSTLPGSRLSKDTESKDDIQLKTSENVITTASSELVDTLIRETLLKVQQKIKAGAFSSEELVSLAVEMNARNLFPKKASSLLPADPVSSTSTTAEQYVQEAINKVLDDIGLTGRSLLTPDMAHGSASRETTDSMSLEDVVDSVITGVLDDIRNGTMSDTDLRKLSSFLRTSTELLVSPESSASLDELRLSSTDNYECRVEGGQSEDKNETKLDPSDFMDPNEAEADSNSPDHILHAQVTDGNILTSYGTGGQDEQVKKLNADIKEETGTSTSEYLDREQNGLIEREVNSFDPDSTEDVVVVPMLGDKPMDIEPDLVDYALGAISHKTPGDLDNPLEPSERNSFGNLLHPDVSPLSYVPDSEECLREQMIKVSSLRIGQPQSTRRLSLGVKPSPIVLRAISNASALHRQPITKPVANEAAGKQTVTKEPCEEEDIEAEEEVCISEVPDFHTREELQISVKESAARASTILMFPEPPVATPQSTTQTSHKARPCEKKSSSGASPSSKLTANRRSSTGTSTGVTSKVAKSSAKSLPSTPKPSSASGKSSSDTCKTGAKSAVAITCSAPKILTAGRPPASKQPNATAKAVSHSSVLGSRGSFKSNPRLVKVESTTGNKGLQSKKTGTETNKKGKKSPAKVGKGMKNGSSSESLESIRRQQGVLEQKISDQSSNDGSTSSFEIKSVCGSHCSVVQVRSEVSQVESNPEEPELVGLKQSPSPPLAEQFEPLDAREDGRVSSEAKEIDDEEIEVVRPTRRIISKTTSLSSGSSKGSISGQPSVLSSTGSTLASNSGNQLGDAVSATKAPVRHLSRVEVLRTSEAAAEGTARQGGRFPQDSGQTIEMVAKPPSSEKISGPSKTPSVQSERGQVNDDQSKNVVSGAHSDTVPRGATCLSTSSLGARLVDTIQGDTEPSGVATSVDSSGSSVELTPKESLSNIDTAVHGRKSDVVYTHSDTQQHEEVTAGIPSSSNPASLARLDTEVPEGGLSPSILTTSNNTRATGSTVQTTIPERSGTADDATKPADVQQQQ